MPRRLAPLVFVILCACSLFTPELARKALEFVLPMAADGLAALVDRTAPGVCAPIDAEDEEGFAYVICNRAGLDVAATALSALVGELDIESAGCYDLVEGGPIMVCRARSAG